MKSLMFQAILIISFISCSNQMQMDTIDTTTVKHLDIEKYLGTWYEIARFPHSFEKGLEGVTASYSLRKDGKIRVVNQGYRGSLEGKLSRSVGKAKIPDRNDPARLKVSFFLFFYGDYYVLELDDEYQWAMIGSSSPRYLWILSRNPRMDENTFNMLLKRARERGYHIDNLIMVAQPQ